MYEKFYEKAWDPSAFGACDHGAEAAVGGNLEDCKLYVHQNTFPLGHMAQVAADIVGAKCETIVTEDKKKSLSGKFPYLETSNGSIIFESEAIVHHFARMNPGAGLHGSSPFEYAKISDWIAWCQQ